MSGRVLVTGGTGTTGRRTLDALRAAGAPAVGAARRPAAGGVRFDWHDPATWAAGLEGTDAAYLVAPAGPGDPAPPMLAWLEAAAAAGVTRIVLLSASLLEAGGPAMGQVHQWLQRSGLGWAVLRPTWFADNFTEGRHRDTIRQERAITTAAGDGRVPFVSADDIAAAAAGLLSADRMPDNDYVLTGSELLDHDQVAHRIGAVIGQPVTHRRVGFNELVGLHVGHGLGREHAETLAFMDLLIADGAEDRQTPDLERLLGRAPTGLSEIIDRNRSAWS